jgi:hypothetical protein
VRISELIKKLEAYKAEHGDQHVKAYDSRGDEGRPQVKEVRWLLGRSRTKVYCVVQSDDDE